jgi:hypothetical protein
MTSHDLIKHSSTLYECRMCGQTWKTKPKARCPGLKVYPNHHYQPLMTKEQLGFIDYQTSEKALPPPVGCYYSHGTGIYVKLYDPAQAVKRQGRARARIRTPLTEIIWPLTCLPLLHTLNEFLNDRSLYTDRSYAEHMSDIANAAVQFAAFSLDEVEKFAGPCIRLSISPSMSRPFYASFQASEKEQIALVSRIAAAYEQHKEAGC